MKGIKSKNHPDPRMNGTYLITDLSQEAPIAKILLTTIKGVILNTNYTLNEIKLGVSAMKPEFFPSLNLIIESIENQIIELVIQK